MSFCALTLQNVFADTLDRFGGHGQDGQTLGKPNLLLGAQKNNILPPAHRVCVYEVRSNDTVLRPGCRC